MAVLRKEYYTQQNGVEIIKVILKPTRVFPNGGYFYAPAEAESLVDSYDWFLSKSDSRYYIRAGFKDSSRRTSTNFHKELFKYYQGYTWQDDVDHINHCEIDNTDQNLNAVTRQQNRFNQYTKGYIYSKDWSAFRAKYLLGGKNYYPFSIVRREDEACIQQNYVDDVILREKLGSDYYMFDFLKYRRGSEDILDLERIGVISEEEATYRHIMKYADNAWYYLRYGLQDYFKAYNIPVPEYDLDVDGFMIDKVTRKKLCPFL